MNTFGTLFNVTTYGESHGPAIGGVIDGCPAGLPIDQTLVEQELRRRREGDDATRSGELTARKEPDVVEWLSGIHEGLTLGTPIAFVIRNTDCRPKDYEALEGLFRPGHADYTYEAKYGWRDPRGGGRASGRETVARVVAGAVAKMVLDKENIHVNATVEGQQVVCTITGLPAGVGEPVFDRLNARLAYAMLSIPSAMSFTLGASAEDWQLPADEYPDAWIAGGHDETLTATNHCGGVQGGISNGMPVVFRVGFHLPVTRLEGMTCRDRKGNLQEVTAGAQSTLPGRHDRNHLTRLPVIVEAMAAITILDLLLQTKK